jgi:DNA-directed RNA polymerase subunit RPC12/RpoP
LQGYLGYLISEFLFIKDVYLMIYLRCIDCGHRWNIVFWEEKKGTKIACPQCKSLNVQRIEKIRGWNQENLAASPGQQGVQEPGKIQLRSERVYQSKGAGMSSKKSSNHRLTSLLKIGQVQIKFNDFIKRFVKHAP